MYRNDGDGIGVVWAGQVPNIAAEFVVGSDMAHFGYVQGVGAVKASTNTDNVYTSTGYAVRNMPYVRIDASLYNAVYSNSYNYVVPRNIKMLYVIKY